MSGLNVGGPSRLRVCEETCSVRYDGYAGRHIALRCSASRGAICRVGYIEKPFHLCIRCFSEAAMYSVRVPWALLGDVGSLYCGRLRFDWAMMSRLLSGFWIIEPNSIRTITELWARRIISLNTPYVLNEQSLYTTRLLPPCPPFVPHMCPHSPKGFPGTVNGNRGAHHI